MTIKIYNKGDHLAITNGTRVMFIDGDEMKRTTVVTFPDKNKDRKDPVYVFDEAEEGKWYSADKIIAKPGMVVLAESDNEVHRYLVDDGIGRWYPIDPGSYATLPPGNYKMLHLGD